jgi:hypothetical protein
MAAPGVVVLEVEEVVSEVLAEVEAVAAVPEADSRKEKK